MSTSNPTMIVPIGSLVAVDTQTLIWGGMRDFVPGVPPNDPTNEKVKRSRYLLHDLDEAKAKLIIPSIVVAELMLPMPEDERGNFLSIITQRFHCPPFDPPSTILAARLWQFGSSLPPQERNTRTILRADIMIVATAKVHGARFFYTDDKNCRKLADKADLIARALPTHSENLFATQDPTEE